MSSGPKIQRWQRKRRAYEFTLSNEAFLALLTLWGKSGGKSRSAVVEDLILEADKALTAGEKA